MTVDLETLRAKLVLDASGFTAGFNEATGQVKRFRFSLTGAIGSVVGFGQKLGLTVLGAQGLAGAARGMFGSLFSGNVAIENTKAQLVAFTKSGEAAEDLLRQIREEAARTPFAFNDMARSVTTLLPVAQQAGVEVMDLVRQAEVLAALNPAEGLTGAAFSLREAVSGDFVSVVERFNLPRQRLNELKAQGVPALEAISIALKEMGVDASLVSGLAQTATGRWSTFTDSLRTLRDTATQPIFEALVASLVPMQRWLDANNERLARMAEAAGVRVAAALRGLGHWLRQNRDLLLTLARVALTVVTTALRVVLAAVGFLGRHLRTLQPVIIGLVAAFVTFYQVVPALQAARAAVVALRVAVLALNPPVLAVAAAVSLLAVAWGRNWFGIRDRTRAAVAAVARALRVLRAALGGGAGLKAAIEGLPKPVQKLLVLLRKLVTVAPNFVRAWQRAGPVAAFQRLAHDLSRIGRTLGNLLAALGLERLGQQVKRAADLVATALRAAVGVVEGIARGDWTRAWRNLTGLGRAAIGLLLTMATALPSALLDLLGQAARAVSRVDWGAAAAALGEAGRLLVRGMVDGVRAGVGALASLLRGLPARVPGFVGDVARTLVGAGRDLLGGLWSGAQDAWGSLVVPFLSGLSSAVLSLVPADIGSILTRSGRRLLRGLWRGVKAVWDDVVSPFFSGLHDAISAVFPTWEKVLEVLKPLGERLFNALWEGIKTVWESIKEFLTGIPAEIARALPDLETLKSFLVEIRDLADEVLGKLAAVGRWLWRKAKGLVGADGEEATAPSLEAPPFDGTATLESIRTWVDSVDAEFQRLSKYVLLVDTGGEGGPATTTLRMSPPVWDAQPTLDAITGFTDGVAREFAGLEQDVGRSFLRLLVTVTRSLQVLVAAAAVYLRALVVGVGLQLGLAATVAAARGEAIKSAVLDALGKLPGEATGFESPLHIFRVKLGEALDTAAQRAGERAGAIRGRIVQALSGLYTEGFTTGAALSRGIIDGLNWWLGAVASAARAVVQAAVRAAKEEAGVASPSLVFRRIGEQMGEGMTAGLRSWEPALALAGARAAGVVSAGASRGARDRGGDNYQVQVVKVVTVPPDEWLRVAREAQAGARFAQRLPRELELLLAGV